MDVFAALAENAVLRLGGDSGTTPARAAPSQADTPPPGDMPFQLPCPGNCRPVPLTRRRNTKAAEHKANPPIVAACEGLCEALAEGAVSGDAAETAGRVRPV